MRLSELFGARDAGFASLLASASAVDEGERFGALVAAQPLDATLARAVARASARFAALAGIDDGILTSGAFGGQQPYVDYYPAVPAKLDALEQYGGFYAFADYAPFGSDRWMARTELPSVTAADGLLRLAIHRPMRAHEGKDLRFVPAPSRATLADVEEKLKAMISATARVVPLARKEAFAALRALLADYEFARERATSAGTFNAIWSARTFRRLGFRLPLLSLSELLEDEELLPCIAETLSLFVRERALIAETVREARQLGLTFTARAEEHLPLAIADANGMRRFVDGTSGMRRFVDETSGMRRFVDADAIDADLLRANRGRWSLDVFAPIFLFRLGVTGIVNGRGSIRYSLVLARVMQRLFGTTHPPNLLCSCAPPATGPFADAVRGQFGEEALRGWEPTLIARLLVDEPHVIRGEIAESWR